MIKKAESISLVPKKNPYYRVTTTFLNAFTNMWECEKYVVESEDDVISYEDKVALKMQEARQEFINMIYRIPIPDNIYMQRGREFEDKVCKGLDEEFSPIVENGAFQVLATKKVKVAGEPILLYGILDVLKAARIIDIKRVVRYKYPKYNTSNQHPMYLELVPEALDFTYIIRDDAGNSHYENYVRENCGDIYSVISDMISWLKANNLWEVFTQKYVMYV